PQLAIHPQPGNRQPGDLTSDGGVITSGAYFLPAAGARPDLVIFGGGYTLYALRATDGSLYWKHAYTGRPELPPDPDNDGTRIFSSPAVVGNRVLFPPRGNDPMCDWDFGATANLGTAPDGTPIFLGICAKDGYCYSLNPETGALRWATNVVFGGFAGGFIATSAYDGARVYGATA